MGFLRWKNMTMVGYSIANSWPGILPAREDPHVTYIAQRIGRTPTQVLHRWALQLGALVIPRSTNKQRIQENLRLFDFELDADSMAALSGLVTLHEGQVGEHIPHFID